MTKEILVMWGSFFFVLVYACCVLRGTGLGIAVLSYGVMNFKPKEKINLKKTTGVSRLFCKSVQLSAQVQSLIIVYTIFPTTFQYMAFALP
ncbi:hypothetical protein E4U19_003400 [Claviceps sp. Clav32 group G5]|nr:hypothetical protein E4U19_003400 [Claviceps sp. Clav32 group G5]